VPDTAAAEVSTIGKLNVSSVTGSVAVDLVLVDALDNRTVLGPLVLAGLTVLGLELQLSRAFFLSLTTMSFPIKGYMRASDRRTECVLPSRSVVTGPCFKVAPFTLDVADFNPLCPDDIYRFALEDQTSITWTEPRLVSVSGSSLVLTRSHAPGSLFSEGVTNVTYKAQVSQDLRIASVVRLSCSFKVCYPTATGFSP
jgi:hypothetical protein